MNRPPSPHVLVIDDDRALSAMLRELLEVEGFRCALAGDGGEGLEKARSLQPDLVILDVMMPGMDGIEILRTLRESSDVPVLMLTAMGDDDDRILGLETGADDYLAKPFVARELVLRIRAILKRAGEKSSGKGGRAHILQAGPLRLDTGTDGATLGDQTLKLTGAEFRILEALVERQGEVVTREHLSEYALGREHLPYDRALDTHVSHLRHKLSPGTDDGICEIRSVRGTGYKLVTG